jgi:hypothetical protein
MTRSATPFGIFFFAASASRKVAVFRSVSCVSESQDWVRNGSGLHLLAIAFIFVLFVFFVAIACMKLHEPPRARRTQRRGLAQDRGAFLRCLQSSLPGPIGVKVNRYYIMLTDVCHAPAGVARDFASQVLVRKRLAILRFVPGRARARTCHVRRSVPKSRQPASCEKRLETASAGA